MASVLVDTSTSAYGAGISSLTYSLTVAANTNRGLHIGVGASRTGAITVSSVQYNSVSSTQDWHTANFGYINDGWSLIAPSSGTHNVVITLSAVATYVYSGAISLYHCQQTVLTHDPQTHAAASSASNSITVSPESDQDLVISSIVAVSAAGDEDTYQGTQRYIQEPLSDHYSGYTQAAVLATTTQTITFFNPYDSLLGAVVFKHESPTYEFLAEGQNVVLQGGEAIISITPNMKFSISGNVITFAEGNEPQPGDILIADYRP